MPCDVESIEEQYEVLLDELRRYNPELLDKDRVLAISKSDMLDEELRAELEKEVAKAFKKVPYVFISSVAQQGLQKLKDTLWEVLNKEPLQKN